jgi:hypothetical protein
LVPPTDRETYPLIEELKRTVTGKGFDELPLLEDFEY